tara:strand:+ start:445 stop:648 length:204 start_codon:yes stop_codon:yes gene_type:complete
MGDNTGMKTMRVQPKLNYKLVGIGFGLNRHLTYDAISATNQPNWKEEGKIFVGEILLKKGEYTVKKD